MAPEKYWRSLLDRIQTSRGRLSRTSLRAKGVVGSRRQTHLIIQEFEKSFLCEDAQHIRISLNRSPSQSMSNPLERAIRPGMAQSGVELIKAFCRAHATDRPSHPNGPRGGQASGLCSPALDKVKANGGLIAQCEALWTFGVPHGSWSTWRGSSSRATEPGKPLTYPVPIASPEIPPVLD